jgi:hypothetical protein
VRSALLLVLCLFRFAPVDAVSPVIWEQNTQDTFGKGEAVSVSITRDGEVQLGPMMTEFADTGEEFVWSLAKGADGTVYAGTGGEGRVYRLSEGASELLFDSPERAIFALSAAQNGTVYAGSSPGGLVYAIPGKGEPRTLARTEDQHVWVLIDDGKGGLYAGTGGGTGRVVRISKSGEVEEVLVASDPNVTSLVRADDGTLYAGTDQNGLIYRVDPSGKVDVLYDASENEIKALAIAGDGSLLAGAMNSARPTPSRGAAGPNARNSGNAPKNGQSVVYSIQTSGSGWRLWDVPAPSVQALSVSPDGSVIVVTGGKGRVYRLFADGSHSVITTVEDAEPWTFESDGKGGGWIASSGSGQVSRLGGTLAREGHLTSEPEDFSLITKWGRVAWEGDASSGTGVAFKVRAGNSEVPDETWGAWTDVSSGPISVRAGRYIQYRMDLSGDGKKTPSVREVMVSGLPENVRPMILDLGISGPHEERAQGGPGGKNGGGRRQSPPPSEDGDGWTISWTGADVNDDPLIYTLHFKGRQERAWKLLAEEVTGNSYSWDTESAPEGDVQVRLTVSDSPANPETHALTSERISAPFKIDHTEPEVRIASVDANANGVTVTGSIVDATSYVKSAAYSLNSGPWKVVFPSDDVFDSGEESLTLTLNGLTAGEYTLVIRASDSRGNVGVAKHVFDVK